MSQLPAGWTSVELVEVVRTVRNGVFVSRPAEHPPGERILRISAVRPMRLDSTDVRYADPVPPNANKATLSAGDVLFTRYSGTRDFVGACAVVGRDAQGVLHPDKLIRVVVDEDVVSPEYLVAAASSPQGRAWLEDVIKTTAGQTGLAGGDLKRLPIPLAPVAEQSRIVGAIEEAFSKLDAGEAGLGNARQLLKRTRDSILSAAVTGRLVPQDPTDTPAARLLAEFGVESIDPPVGAPATPAGWGWCSMGSLADGSGYGTSVKCDYDEDGVGVLRIPNIQRGALDLDDLKRAPAGAPISDDLILTPGDLLIVRTNGSRDLIGRAAPVTEVTGHSFASYLIRFRTRSDVVRVEYLALMLAARWWRDRLEDAAASSAGQYNLSLAKLDPLPVALPPLPEQVRILAEVERQMSFIEACERSVDAGLATSAALRRSVLRVAFEGWLVPQDPADEPASVLLERIRAERAAAPKPKKRRTRATA